MSYFIVNSNQFRKTAEYVAIQYHKKDHGYGLHNLVLGCGLPIDFIYPSEKRYEKHFIGEPHNISHKVEMFFGKKRKKLTIKISHGNGPIPFKILYGLEESFKFELLSIYKFDFKGSFNVICFELHYGNEGIRAEGLKNYELCNLIEFLEPLFLKRL